MPVKKTTKAGSASKSETEKPVKKAAGAKPSKPAKAPEKTNKPAKPEKPAKPAKSSKSRSASRSVKPSAVLNNSPQRQVSGYDEKLTNNGPIPVAELRKLKTGLTKKDLEYYKKMLLEKRAELLGDVGSLEEETREHSAGNSSSMPDHMADAGTDSFEHEATLSLMEKERKLLAEIDGALLRIKEGIYGICLETGQPIGRERLEFKPWARYCIAVARELEKKGLINN